LAALNLKNKARVLEENLTNFLRDDSNDVFLASEGSIPIDCGLPVARHYT
jgi:hypothetical protein